jgi:hypothetical protein
MRLKEIAEIRSGYLNRGRIEPRQNGSHYLIQARDVDAEDLYPRADTLARINPVLSPSDCTLRSGDILFMARGSRNYALLLKEVPGSTLAAASFFIVRTNRGKLIPGYVAWYLNQDIGQRYFHQHSGRGVHMPVVRRSVLENIEIPVPGLVTQKKITEVYALMRREKTLFERLAAKRKELLSAVCLRAARAR